MGFWILVGSLLRGKQTILEPVLDDENIEFPNGSMVIKGEYLTLAAQQKRKGWYVYQDYRPGAIVYYFTNLVVGINIKMHILSNKNRSHVQYLLPHIENERLMDTIGSRDDPDGLLEWVHCQVLLDCKVWLYCQVHYLTFKVHVEA